MRVCYAGAELSVNRYRAVRESVVAGIIIVRVVNLSLCRLRERRLGGEEEHLSAIQSVYSESKSTTIIAPLGEAYRLVLLV